MKFLRVLALLPVVFLFACQANAPLSVTIIDGETITQVTTSERVPLLILSEAGIVAQPNDRVRVNGHPSEMDEAITAGGSIQLQLRRAVSVQLITSQGGESIQTSAFTVGDVLSEAGIPLGIHDEVSLPLNAPVTDGLTIIHSPARELVVTTGGNAMEIRSAAETVGEALAEAGFPLQGLDTSFPAENEALPLDGQIKVVRVIETVEVEIRSIPFSSETTYSEDIAFGESEIVQAGVNGVAMIRTRIRYEDGVEVRREVEGETVLSEPQKQLVASGSKIVLAPVGGDVPYQYWYATQMYATVYSPCASGTGGCSYGTASGARAGYGIVAVDYSIYSYLAGMKVYVPGYGVGTIGDTGGGPILETQLGIQRSQWIDLGYNDGALGNLSGWVTVYFLEPAPAEIPYFFQQQ